MGHVGTIQLDAVNVVERTQFVVPFSRLGAYDPTRFHAMTGPGGEWFEYWGHAASLMPARMQPLLRWKMDRFGELQSTGKWGERLRSYIRANADYVAAVRDEVRDRGPLTASDLSDPRRRDGEWWGRRSEGRQVLEWLFGHGEVVAWREPSFERVYDLPHRALPAEVLATPTPPVEDAKRALVASAVRSLGVATISDVADYFRMKRADAQHAVEALVEEGQLVGVTVEGWRHPGFCPADVDPRPPRRSTATLLSPFDSLIWARDRTARLFGFDYRIEIYVPSGDRRHGYYVLPLLLGDELVARFDLKADRQVSVLRVLGVYAEPGADRQALVDAALPELDRLRSWLGLGRLTVGRRGNLAKVLRP